MGPNDNENEYNRRERKEQENKNMDSTVLLVQFTIEATRLLKAIFNEVRATRNDLRNLDKLRPLKAKVEDTGEEEVQAGVGDVTEGVAQ